MAHTINTYHFPTIEAAEAYAERTRDGKSPHEDLKVSVWWNDGSHLNQDWMREGFIPRAEVEVESWT